MTKIHLELSEWVGQIGTMPSWIVYFGLKGCGVIALMFCTLWMMKRSSAATKSVLLKAAMAALLLLPLLIQTLPNWHIPYRAQQTAPSAAGMANDVPEVTISVHMPSDQNTPETARPELSVAAPSRSASFWISGVWVIGCLIVVARLGASWLGVSLLGSRSTRIDEGPMMDSLEKQKAKFGLSRKVILLTSARRSMPMTWGTLRPRILLPEGSASWPRAELDTVLLHELAHIGRADCLAQGISQLACALHWFNPLVWIASRRLGIENERATDDAVIECGTRPSEYAKTLLNIVADVAPAQSPALAAVAMAQTKSVEKRIVTVLDSTVNRSKPTLGHIASMAFLVGLLVVPLAMVEADDEEEELPIPELALPAEDNDLATIRGFDFREVPPDSATQLVRWSEGMEIRTLEAQLSVLKPLNGIECIEQAAALGIDEGRLTKLLDEYNNHSDTVSFLNKSGLGPIHPDMVASKKMFDVISFKSDRLAEELIISLENRLDQARAGASKKRSAIRVATPTPGIVSNVAIARGQEVNAATVLLELDPTEMDGKIALIRQEVEFAEKSVSLKMEAVNAASIPLDNALKSNAKGLTKKSVVREAQKEHREAKEAALLAESELNSAKLRLTLAERERDRLRIRAPAKGTIIEVLCHVGEYVSPASPVVILAPSGAE